MIRAFERERLPELYAALRAACDRVVGPTARDGAIVLTELASVEELPVGLRDEQAPGRYRLGEAKRAEGGAPPVFGYVSGPRSAKEWLFPSQEKLYTAERRPDGRIGFSAAARHAPKTALLGVRACDVAAVRKQDRILLEGEHADARYAARREKALLVAVSCLEPGELCFCASTGTGPKPGEGADLVLSELGERFLIEARTPEGEAVLSRLTTREASEEETAELERGLARAEASMGRHLDIERLPEKLYARLDHPRWAEVAERCLSCGNCTSVCPTCFCTDVVDESDLDATTSARTREWLSCFSADHGKVHGFDPRPHTIDRYRQWVTHKLGGWVAQFGETGCTGCGRCIAWCPVGIDLTEEVNAIVEGPAPASRHAPIPMHAAPAPVAAPMLEQLLPREARVVDVIRETADVVTLALDDSGGAGIEPGQFQMLSLPGLGESAISCSGRGPSGELLHTVRGVGPTSRAIEALTAGASIGVRGPYGNHWPIELARGRVVTVIAGGLGISPLRGAIRALMGPAAGVRELRLLLGARSPEDLPFAEEIAAWREHARVELTVDRAGPDWQGHVGVVTRLLPLLALPRDGLYLSCGPEVMMRFIAQGLVAAGVPREHIYVSTERHMKCGAGLCGRCQHGPSIICRDGPVFSYDRVEALMAREGF